MLLSAQCCRVTHCVLVNSRERRKSTVLDLKMANPGCDPGAALLRELVQRLLADRSAVACEALAMPTYVPDERWDVGDRNLMELIAPPPLLDWHTCVQTSRTEIYTEATWIDILFSTYF